MDIRKTGGRFICGTCGRQFGNLVHLRSHQSRICSTAVVRKQPPCTQRTTVADCVRDDDLNDTDENNLAEAEVSDRDVETEGNEECETEPYVLDSDIGEDEFDDIDPTRFQLTESVMVLLDGQDHVADDIFHFYDSLNQHYEPVVKDRVDVPEAVAAMPNSIQRFLQHCNEENLCMSAVCRLYELFLSYEQDIPEDLRLFRIHLPCVSYLQATLRAIRDARLFREGWNISVIDLNDLHRHLILDIPVNRSGTFRCPLRLAREELTRLGMGALKPFSESTDSEGRRTYSNPIDGRAFQAYTEAIGDKGSIIGVDVYCDGVPLPNSGTQSVSPLRVRFPNVSGIETKWWDIGLCPMLDFRSVKCTTEKKAELRRELMHRYMFLVMKPMLEASKHGFRINSALIFPRMFMIVCDQKQERPMVCMRSAGGARDCTLCDMVSKVTKAESNRRGSQSKNGQIQQSRNGITASTSTDSLDSLLLGEEVDQDSLKRQLIEQHGGSRPVLRTLGAQLKLSVYKVMKAGKKTEILLSRLRTKLHDQWFESSPLDIADIRKYLIVQSCCDLPPVFAAMYGLGSVPHLLYHSVAFDSLHVLDLGVVRLLPDLCYDHFAKKKYTNRPATQCIAEANQRLLNLPRGAHLPKNPLFLTKRNEKLPGITGLIRRASLPFLWICVLGLNDKVDPDDDPLLQVALELADLHALLLGSNESFHDANRTEAWITAVQRRCFELGKQMVQVFGSNVTTKMHRFMRHLEDHLTSFGMLRWGANDQNETKHKSVKAAYRLTNRHGTKIAEQLLRAGYADDNDHCTNLDSAVQSVDTITASNLDPRLINGPLRCTQSQLNTSHTFEQRVVRVHGVRYSTSRSLVWKKVSYITLSTKFPWPVNPKFQYLMEKFSYRPWTTISGEVRMDGCVYILDGVTLHGIVQSILRSVRFKDHAFLLIRRLVEAQPRSGNVFPTERYDHRYFQYSLNSHSGVQLDLVPFTDVQHPAFFVPDPNHLKQALPQCFSDITKLETPANRQKSRFFRIHGVRLSSFKEYIIL